MSISSEITRLQNAKASIKTSIENKGVTVPSNTKLDGYSSLINSIGKSTDFCVKELQLTGVTGPHTYTAGTDLVPDAGYTKFIGIVALPASNGSSQLSSVISGTSGSPSSQISIAGLFVGKIIAIWSKK